jgi:hypothetical protein
MVTETPKFDIDEIVLKAKQKSAIHSKRNEIKKQIREERFVEYGGEKIKREDSQIGTDMKTLGNLKYIFGSGEEVEDWKLGLKDFIRAEPLKVTDINPVLFIRSAREIDGVKECFNAIDFLDVVWIKNYPMKEAMENIRKYVAEHKEYTHIILSSDDIFPTPEIVLQLLNDVLIWDFPAIAGCCNFCPVWLPANKMLCPLCRKGEQHPEINVTKEPVEYKTRIPVSPSSYTFVTDEYRISHPVIEKVWFQGHALCCMRRDIFEKFGCLPYTHRHNGSLSYSDDFAFAVSCAENDVSQFVDYRIFMKHDATHHKELMIDKGKKAIIMRKPRTFLPSILVSEELVPILICSPFNNESHSVDMYVNSLISINYPKHLIDLIWLENDSVDGTYEMLERHYKEIKRRYNYHSFKLIRKSYGLESLGKLTPQDFGEKTQVFSGKNYIDTTKKKIARAQRLVDIYHFFFSQLDPVYHKYWMMLMTDVVVPPNIIGRYLEVFRKFPDAGWVGGVHHKRYPTHIRRSITSLPHEAGLAAPLIFTDNFHQMRYMTDEEILLLQKKGYIIFECGATGHAWMVDTQTIFDGARMDISTFEIIVPFIKKMAKMGKKVYCASDIYLKHISLDGKIYREDIFEEVARFTIDGEYKKRQEKYAKALADGLLEKQFIQDEQVSKIDSMLKASKMDAELREYIEFVARANAQNHAIPSRPPKGCTTFDKIYNKVIDTDEWDKLYSKWKVFIETKIERKIGQQ